MFKTRMLHNGSSRTVELLLEEETLLTLDYKADFEGEPIVQFSPRARSVSGPGALKMLFQAVLFLSLPLDPVSVGHLRKYIFDAGRRLFREIPEIYVGGIDCLC